MSELAVSTVLDYSDICLSEDKDVHLMVNLKAPAIEIEGSKRVPLEICIALDCSYSMNGSKIKAMKDSVKLFIDNLTSNDTIGILGFSDTVWKITEEPMRATADNKIILKSKVDELGPIGGTNIELALKSSFEMLSGDKKSEEVIKRAMLFTDGDATVGMRSYEGLAGIVQNRQEDISLSTFGYGEDHVAELLGEFARKGHGNNFYVQKLDECAYYFGIELGGLLTTFAKNIEVRITPNPKVEIEKVLNNVKVFVGENNDKEVDITPERIQILLEGEQGDPILVKMDDMYGEEAKNLIIKMKVLKDCNESEISQISVKYDNVQTKENNVFASASATVAIVVDGAQQKEPNQDVEEQVLILESAQAQHEAVRLADEGKYNDAKERLNNFSDALKRSACYASSRGLQDLDQSLEANSNEMDNYNSGIKNSMVYGSRGISRGRVLSKGVAGDTLFAANASLETFAADFTASAPQTQDEEEEEK